MSIRSSGADVTELRWDDTFVLQRPADGGRSDDVPWSDGRRSGGRWSGRRGWRRAADDLELVALGELGETDVGQPGVQLAAVRELALEARERGALRERENRRVLSVPSSLKVMRTGT